MKAFRYYGPNAAFRLEDTAVAPLEQDSVLVKIKASGICGSDLYYMRGIKPGKVPVTLGHEMSGVVEGVGRNVRDFSEGDRVVVDYVISCGQCFYCNQGAENLCVNYRGVGYHIDGGYAEYVVVPARNVFKLPDSIPFEQGAIIGCAVATSFHSLGVSGIKPGESIAVYGLGGVGIHVVQWAKAFGAGKIIGVDIDPGKLEAAKDLGCDTILNSRDLDPVSEIMKITDGLGVNVAIECIGIRETLGQAIAGLGKKGRMVFVGNYFEDIPISPRGMIVGEKSLSGSADHTRNDLRRIIHLTAAGRIDLSKSITHRVKFEDLNVGVEILDKKSGSPLRVVAVQ